jgi:hypothetical protein
MSDCKLEKFFVAIGVQPTGNPGTRKATRAEAEEWARSYLLNNPDITQVVIYEAVALVEKSAPPITVRDIDWVREVKLNR